MIYLLTYWFIYLSICSFIYSITYVSIYCYFMRKKCEHCTQATQHQTSLSSPCMMNHLINDTHVLGDILYFIFSAYPIDIDGSRGHWRLHCALWEHMPMMKKSASWVGFQHSFHCSLQFSLKCQPSKFCKDRGLFQFFFQCSLLPRKDLKILERKAMLLKTDHHGKIFPGASSPRLLWNVLIQLLRLLPTRNEILQELYWWT